MIKVFDAHVNRRLVLPTSTRVGAVQHCCKLATRLVRDDLANKLSAVACTDHNRAALTVQECAQRLARGIELSR